MFVMIDGYENFLMVMLFVILKMIVMLIMRLRIIVMVKMLLMMVLLMIVLLRRIIDVGVIGFEVVGKVVGENFGEVVGFEVISE
jgi:hypothetical protein